MTGRGQMTIAEDSPVFRKMVKLHQNVMTAAELAARVGVPDDEEFRQSITHHTQGSRSLAGSRERFMRPSDPLVRYERMNQREKALAVLPGREQDRIRRANRALYGDAPA